MITQAPVPGSQARAIGLSIFQRFFLWVLEGAATITKPFAATFSRVLAIERHVEISDKTAYILGRMLRSRGYYLSDTTLANEIYDSLEPGGSILTATSQALTLFGLSCKGYKQNSEEAIHPKGDAMLVHLRSGEPVELVSYDDSFVRTHQFDYGNRVYSRSDFSATWSGIAIELKQGPGYREHGYFEKRISEIWVSLRWRLFSLISVVSLLLLVGLKLKASLISDSYVDLSLGMLAIASTVCCIAIVALYLVPRSGLSTLFCGGSSAPNCGSVLTSNESKVLGISLGDIGLVYSLGQALVFLTSNSVSIVVYGISAMAVFFVPYALYIQAHILGKFCKVCLTILAIHSLISMISLSVLWSKAANGSLFSLPVGLSGVFLLCLPAIVWSILRPSITSDNLGHGRLAQARHSNRQNFVEKVKELIPLKAFEIGEYKGEIVIEKPGPGDANLVVYLTPSCRHCRGTFHEVEQGAAGGFLPSRTFLRLIIKEQSSGQPHAVDFRVATAIYALSIQHSDRIAMDALTDWYGTFSPNRAEDWLKTLPKISAPAIELGTKTAQDISASFNKLNLRGTPALVLNNRLMPGHGGQSDFFLLRRLARQPRVASAKASYEHD